MKPLTIRCSYCGTLNEIDPEFSRPIKCFKCHGTVQSRVEEISWTERLRMIEQPTEPEYGRFRDGITFMFEVYLFPNGLTGVFDNEGHQLGPFQGRPYEVLELIRNFKSNETLFYDNSRLDPVSWEDFYGRYS